MVPRLRTPASCANTFTKVQQWKVKKKKCTTYISWNYGLKLHHQLWRNYYSIISIVWNPTKTEQNNFYKTETKSYPWPPFPLTKGHMESLIFFLNNFYCNYNFKILRTCHHLQHKWNFPEILKRLVLFTGSFRAICITKRFFTPNVAAINFIYTGIF